MCRIHLDLFERTRKSLHCFQFPCKTIGISGKFSRNASFLQKFWVNWTWDTSWGTLRVCKALKNQIQIGLKVSKLNKIRTLGFHVFWTFCDQALPISQNWSFSVIFIIFSVPSDGNVFYGLQKFQVCTIFTGKVVSFLVAWKSVLLRNSIV